MEYTAHISKDDRVQTVCEHCRNTAKLCSDYAAEAGLQFTGELAGMLHDLGKQCADFDAYIKGSSRFSRGQIDHAYFGARYIWELGSGGSQAVREVARLIAHVIISHHGLHDWIDIDQKDYFAERTSKSERYDELRANAEKLFPQDMIMPLLEKSAQEIGNAYSRISRFAATDNKELQKKNRAFYTGMLERFLQSCLIDADRTDTENFMNGYECPVKDTAEVWEEMRRNMEQRLAGFSGKKDAISALRQDISDRCAAFADHNVGTVRLIVPTGGGKTLSSLRFAIEYCRKYGMKKIVYTAPYMSILEQNSSEFRQIAGEENFLEHHSNIFAEKNSAEELADYELACIHWTSPVIATTMVQFLNTLFSGRTDAVRHFHRLCGAVMIIDEIQSLPLKCVYLFDLAVNFLTRFMGGAAVLCSATQPQLDMTKFPVILDERGSMTGDFSRDFEAFRRTKAVPLLKNGGYSFDEAAEMCMEKFRDSGNLLVIVNTRRSAAELFRRLSDLNSAEQRKAVMSHISTRLCPAHRKHEIGEIRRLLSENKPVICVTTQLIEAGVDISFSCVVRSLAGLDNAAQAAGRCNRNGESECREVYILELGEERLNGLPEIRKACACTKSVCTQCGSDDLLSPEAAAEYFSRYYSEMEDVLSYEYNDASVKTDLLDLLSLNKARNNPGSTAYTGQAFRTAGDKFEVIDNDTRAVIVPYNDEARDIIESLNGSLFPAECAELQRKAQQYTVGVYPNELRELTDAGAVYPLRSGAFALTEGYYDQSLGMTSSGTPESYIF